jgi:hypothetical protein
MKSRSLSLFAWASFAAAGSIPSHTASVYKTTVHKTYIPVSKAASAYNAASTAPAYKPSVHKTTPANKGTWTYYSTATKTIIVPTTITLGPPTEVVYVTLQSTSTVTESTPFTIYASTETSTSINPFYGAAVFVDPTLTAPIVSVPVYIPIDVDRCGKNSLGIDNVSVQGPLRIYSDLVRICIHS